MSTRRGPDLNAEPVGAADAQELTGADLGVEVRLSGSRDEEFEEFVAYVGPYLIRVALLLSGDRNQAEDLVQTTFERTYRSWKRARSTDPRAYACRILGESANRSLAWLPPGSADVPYTLPEHATPSHADAVDARNEVIRVLAELPPAQRRVVVLRHLLDLTESETARELDISVGTVKSNNARAMARLRTLLIEGRQ